MHKLSSESPMVTMPDAHSCSVISTILAQLESVFTPLPHPVHGGVPGPCLRRARWILQCSPKQLFPHRSTEPITNHWHVFWPFIVWLDIHKIWVYLKESAPLPAPRWPRRQPLSDPADPRTPSLETPCQPPTRRPPTSHAAIPANPPPGDLPPAPRGPPWPWHKRP